MADPVLAAARLIQYGAGALLFGLPAFRLYGLRGPSVRAERLTLVVAATLLATGALAALAAQAAAMTGQAAAAADPTIWWEVATATQVGHALGGRVAIGLVLLVISLGAAARRGAPWRSLSLLGGLTMASFAWSGHGAAGEGATGVVQLVADVAHLLAAGLWLGALAGLGIALARPPPTPPGDRQALVAALEGFAGIGSALVATLILTGLVNMWVLVTPARLPALVTTAYGLLLLAKLALFGVMLGCAALNRFRIMPALRAAGEAPLGPLRRSLVLETACGVAVLALVAWFAMLPPPAAL